MLIAQLRELERQAQSLKARTRSPENATIEALTLIQNIMENKTSDSRGPVQNISSITFMLLGHFPGKPGLAETKSVCASYTFKTTYSRQTAARDMGPSEHGTKNFGVWIFLYQSVWYSCHPPTTFLIRFIKSTLL